MKKKNSNLILKGLTHNGEPFTKEIHTLDEVKSTGSYTVICRNASTGEGLPAISGHTENCFCCEAQLIVTGCYSENESQSDTAYGQTITICDRETGNTATYTRTITPTKNGGKWSEWQMVATGDIELVSQNSDINKQLTTLSTEQKAEVTRAIAAEQQLQRELNSLKETVISDEYLSYGIEFDVTISSPTCTRIGNAILHKTLPIHNAMRRCLLDDNGNITTYLDANDSNKTADGENADLTGANGMVMVEIPKHYRKFIREGNKQQVFISQFPLAGYHEVPKMYRSAYEATVDRTVSGTPKLASVVNTSAEFRGGNNTSDWDGTYRSLLGMPATSISLSNFRKYARNRGSAGRKDAGWNCDLYEAQLATYWLYVIEYANRNCQAEYNAELTSEGYRQGGLSAGVTTIDVTKWNTYNNYNPFIPCGTTNILGNNTGVVTFVMPNEYDINNNVTISVPSYRGIENPFGHIWSWTDGCKCQVQSDTDGAKSLFYTCYDPALFQDSSYTNYNKRGEVSRKEGYVKTLIIGEYGDNMPVETGGSSTTYYTDYLYSNIPDSGEEMRGICFGGFAVYGQVVGLSFVSTQYTTSYQYMNIGTRLCFLP